jgi:hypothetical protein
MSTLPPAETRLSGGRFLRDICEILCLPLNQNTYVSMPLFRSLPLKSSILTTHWIPYAPIQFRFADCVDGAVEPL